MTKQNPENIGPYEIESILGVGGMGVVYKAWTPVGLPVAVKVINHQNVSNPKYRSRFRREIEAARRVPRFCTAPIIDANTDAENPYLATEYIPGPSLAQAIKDEGPRYGGDLEALAVAIAAALTAIHDVGITHRDLKPSNVLLGPYGPRVIDFGLAAIEETQDSVSSSGQVLGTLAFMAPEQQRGDSVTTAADIFSWGATIAFAATGKLLLRTPVEDDSPAVAARFWTVANDYRRDIGGVIGELVINTLSLKPQERPSSVEILERLTRLKSSSRVLMTAARPVSRGKPLDPQDAHDWEARAAQALADKRPTYALFLAERGIAANPLHAKCHYIRGLALIALHQPIKGSEALLLAYEMDPFDIDIRREYARTLLNGDSSNILKAWDVDPDDEVVRSRYVEHLLEVNGPTQSRSDAIMRAFELAPQNSKAQIRYIDLVCRENRPPDAVRHLSTLISEFTTEAKKHFFRMISYWIQHHQSNTLATHDFELEQLVDEILQLDPPEGERKLLLEIKSTAVKLRDDSFALCSGYVSGALVFIVGFVVLFRSSYTWWLVILVTLASSVLTYKVVYAMLDPVRISERWQDRLARRDKSRIE
jgi:serine/threonine protein kinase